MSYTNTRLATHRSCPWKEHLRYGLQLERVGEKAEALTVGTCWHKAHEAKGGLDQLAPMLAIGKHAPSELWAEKLRRMFAAHEWYWQGQQYTLLAPEHTFRVDFHGYTFEGQIDGIVETEDGQRGLLEIKTTSDGVDAESGYWDRLRLDTQVGIYGMACAESEFFDGRAPSFILYDVTRKPTINPKRLPKTDVARMLAEIEKTGSATYFGESFPGDEIAPALAEARESYALYGARLTADIGNRPDYYFARRNVARTAADYAMLDEHLVNQIQSIDHSHAYRSPEACNVYGLCEFFSLCSNNIVPTETDVPEGFQRREHLHPELADDEQG